MNSSLFSQKQSLYICFLLVVVILLGWLFTINLPFMPAITSCLLFACFVYSILINRIIKYYNFKCFFSLFIIISFPFYFGHHILSVFNTNIDKSISILSGKLPLDSIVNASFIILLSIVLLSMGYFLCRNKYIDPLSSYSINSKYNSWQDDKYIRIFAIILLLVSIYPTFKELVGLIKLNLLYGYAERRGVDEEYYNAMIGMSTLENYIAGWFLPAIYLLLMNSKKKLRQIFVPIFLLLVFCVLYLFTGSRFELLKVFVSLFFIICIWRGIRIKFLKMIIPITIVLIVFGTISATRSNVESNGLSSLQSNVEDFSSNNPIESIIWESGITFTTVSNVIDKCPRVVPHFYGGSYLGALIICLPNFLRLNFDKNEFSVSRIFSPLYYGTDSHGYGSSFIAELYYNFGFFLIFLLPMLGVVMAKIDDSIIISSLRRKPLTFLVSIFFAGEFLYAVRNDMYAIPRNFLFSVGIPIVIYFLIYKLVAKGIKYKSLQ